MRPANATLVSLIIVSTRLFISFKNSTQHTLIRDHTFINLLSKSSAHYTFLEIIINLNVCWQNLLCVIYNKSNFSKKLNLGILDGYLLLLYTQENISIPHDYLGPHVYSCRRNYPPHMFIWDHMIIRATRVHTYILDENSLFFLLPFQIRHCFDDTLASRCSTAIKKHIPCLSLMSR